MPRLSALSSRSLTGIGIAPKVEWILSAATYTSKSFSVASQDTSPAGISFKKDGTVMYIAGRANSSVRQYTLSTPWDVSTASFANKSLSVSAQTDVNSVDFKGDGTTMYVAGWNNSRVYQYTLSTAWDVSTGTYSGVSFNYNTGGAVGTAAYGLRFSSTGSNFYITGNNDTIFQFNLSTAWDLSTASDPNISKFVGAKIFANPSGIDFKYDGTIMFVQDTSPSGNRQVTAWTMSTPWDLSTATESTTNIFGVGNQDPNPYDFYMRYDGLGFYVVGPNNDTVYQYSMGSFRQPAYTYVSVVPEPLPTVTSFYGNAGLSTTVSSSRLTLSTAQARFGTKSLLGSTAAGFGGRANSVNIVLPSSLIPPLTIEAWVYLTVGYVAPNFEQSPPIYLHSPTVDIASTNATNSIRLYGVGPGLQISYTDQIVQAGSIIGGGNDSNATSIPLNTWTHMALAIAANGITKAVWINGTRREGTNLNTQLTASMTALTLNAFGSGRVGPQYIDEVRVSNVDRYGVTNTTITVPTAAFTSDANTVALVKF